MCIPIYTARGRADPSTFDAAVLQPTNGREGGYWPRATELNPSPPPPPPPLTRASHTHERRELLDLSRCSRMRMHEPGCYTAA